MAEDVSLEHAVFWMNLHLELLAAHQKALRHMRDLVAGGGGWPEAYDPDFQLVAIEVERTLERLRYWEEVVDKSNRAAHLRPILAGFGLRES